MFQTLLKSSQWNYEGTDYDISNDMADYLANFVKTGDPNGDGLAAWTPYTSENPKAMQFESKREMTEIALDEHEEELVGKLLHNQILFGLSNNS